MGARTKSPTKATSEEARGFAVVVETMHAEFTVFGEALGGLRTQMTDGFEEMHRRFVEVDQRFDRVERDLGLVKQDLGLVKHDLGLVKHDLGLVKVAVLEHGRELRELRSAVTDLAATKVARDEVETIVERALARSGPR